MRTRVEPHREDEMAAPRARRERTPARDVLALQRAAGNRAVAALLRPGRPLLQRYVTIDGRVIKSWERDRIVRALDGIDASLASAFRNAAANASPPHSELRDWLTARLADGYAEGFSVEQLMMAATAEEDLPEAPAQPPRDTPAPAPGAKEQKGKKRPAEWGPGHMPAERDLLPEQRAPYGMNDRVRELITARLDDLLRAGRSEALGKSGETAFRKAGTGPERSTQRSLDRLAWVLAHLKDARECVAVTIVTIDDASASLFAWANKQDDKILGDMQRLIAAARESAEEASEALKQLWTDYGKSKLDYRKGTPTRDDWHVAERRLLKTLRFLRDFETNVAQIEPKTIHAKYVEPAVASGEKKKARIADKKVHAEQRGADLIKLAKGERHKRRSADEDEAMPDADERWRFMFGISKLCCFHCDRGLKALAQTAGIDIVTSGSHFTTYGDWPIPHHLRGPKEVRAFLGVPEDEKQRSADDGVVAAAIESNLDFVLYVIRGYKGTGGLETTDYISSEDEDELEFEKFPAK